MGKESVRSDVAERIVTRSGPHHVRSILSLCLSLSAPLPSLSDVVGSPASFVTLYHLQPPFVPEDVRSVVTSGRRDRTEGRR